MPDKTTNHGFQLWKEGETNWEHRSDFKKLDKRVELRGPLSDRPDDAPDGTKFVVTDGDRSGTTFIYDGDASAWEPLGVEAPSVRADELHVNVGDSASFTDAPLVVPGSPSIAFQRVDREYAGPWWYSSSGERLLHHVSDENDQHHSIYLKGDALGSGDTQPEKLVDWEWGTPFEVKWQNIGRFQISSSDPSENTLFHIVGGEESGNNRLRFGSNTSDGGATYPFEFRHWVAEPSLTLVGPGGQSVRFNADSTVTVSEGMDLDGNPVTGLREVGPEPSPGDLSEGEWAFTDDYDGSDTPAWLYKDSSGTAHVLTTDDTL